MEGEGQGILLFVFVDKKADESVLIFFHLLIF